MCKFINQPTVLGWWLSIWFVSISLMTINPLVSGAGVRGFAVEFTLPWQPVAWKVASRGFLGR